MHRAGVVRQKQPALSQLLDQLLEGRLTDEIEAAIAQRRGDLRARPPRPWPCRKEPIRRRSPPPLAAKRSGNQRFAGPYSAPGTESQSWFRGTCADGRGGERNLSDLGLHRLTIARGRGNAPPDAAAAPSARACARSGSRASAGDARRNQPGAERRPARARAPRGTSSGKTIAGIKFRLVPKQSDRMPKRFSA